METLTGIIKKLDETIENCLFDLKSDWITEDDKIEMTIQLQHLIIAKANLDLLAKNPKSQLFSSCISFN